MVSFALVSLKGTRNHIGDMIRIESRIDLLWSANISRPIKRYFSWRNMYLVSYKESFSVLCLCLASYVLQSIIFCPLLSVLLPMSCRGSFSVWQAGFAFAARLANGARLAGRQRNLAQPEQDLPGLDQWRGLLLLLLLLLQYQSKTFVVWINEEVCCCCCCCSTRTGPS